MTQFKKLCRGLMMVGALVLISSPALADRRGPPAHKPPKAGRGVPEIDPLAVGAIASVLVGGTLLIGARRRRRAPRA